jgi:hypothetical protein
MVSEWAESIRGIDKRVQGIEKRMKGNDNRVQHNIRATTRQKYKTIM